MTRFPNLVPVRRTGRPISILQARCWFWAVSFIFTGCGGSQGAGAASFSPTSAATTPQKGGAHSWILPNAKSQDLIYATGGCGGTCVLSYPAGKLVGTLDVGDAGACVDNSGNVYIANDNNLFEYAHAGTTPINTFKVSYGSINGCSVDLETGDVATTIDQSSVYNVAVFSTPSSSPTTYLISFDIQYCAFDQSGDLFVDGYGGYGKEFSLYELSKSGDEFFNISVTPNIKARPGQVQWVGNYLTAEGIGISKGASVYRLSIAGSTATISGITKFKGITKSVSQSWIYNHLIMVPYGTRGNRVDKTRVGVWKYPAGGKPLQAFAKFANAPDFQAVTFSPSS